MLRPLLRCCLLRSLSRSRLPLLLRCVPRGQLPRPALPPAAQPPAAAAPPPTTLVPQPLVRINAAIAALSAPVPDAWRPLVTEERAVAWRLFSFVYLMRRLLGDGVKKANGPAVAAAMGVATSMTTV